MNPARQAFCRAYQAAFRAALPVMPYREPTILESTDDIAALCTVLGIDSAGKLGVLGDTGLTAYGILCDDIDATAEVVAEVYLTGQFNTNALIVKESYTMTTTDIQALRNGGIFLENSMKF